MRPRYNDWALKWQREVDVSCRLQTGSKYGCAMSQRIRDQYTIPGEEQRGIGPDIASWRHTIRADRGNKSARRIEHDRNIVSPEDPVALMAIQDHGMRRSSHRVARYYQR